MKKSMLILSAIALLVFAGAAFAATVGHVGTEGVAVSAIQAPAEFAANAVTLGTVPGATVVNTIATNVTNSLAQLYASADIDISKVTTIVLPPMTTTAGTTAFGIAGTTLADIVPAGGLNTDNVNVGLYNTSTNVVIWLDEAANVTVAGAINGVGVEEYAFLDKDGNALAVLNDADAFLAVNVVENGSYNMSTTAGSVEFVPVLATAEETYYGGGGSSGCDMGFGAAAALMLGGACMLIRKRS